MSLMAVRKQDLSVLALHFLGYATLRNLSFRLRGIPVARFLAFHDLPETDEANFNAKLTWLKARTNVVSLEDFFDGRLSRTKLNVGITFDDGYKGWIKTAIPVLQRLGLPATFFVSSGFVGLSPNAQAEYARRKLLMPAEITGGLDPNELKAIADLGFAIGGHTVNHVNLRDPADYDTIQQEIVEDKRFLESIIGRPIQFFAYPFGAKPKGDRALIEILKTAGYRGAVTTAAGLNTPRSHRFLLRRDLTGVPMPIHVFSARVSGNYDGVEFIRNAARKVREGFSHAA